MFILQIISNVSIVYFYVLEDLLNMSFSENKDIIVIFVLTGASTYICCLVHQAQLRTSFESDLKLFCLADQEKSSGLQNCVAVESWFLLLHSTITSFICLP